MSYYTTLGLFDLEILYIQALLESINGYVRPYKFKEIGEAR